VLGVIVQEAEHNKACKKRDGRNGECDETTVWSYWCNYPNRTGYDSYAFCDSPNRSFGHVMQNLLVTSEGLRSPNMLRNGSSGVY
jgi:hypothetical protein